MREGTESLSKFTIRNEEGGQINTRKEEKLAAASTGRAIRKSSKQLLHFNWQEDVIEEVQEEDGLIFEELNGLTSSALASSSS